ncbi:MAG: hypothetical protein J6L83_01295 [Clostridia bacterium]|nr:hypothetical protein [Clostridia bacterium]
MKKKEKIFIPDLSAAKGILLSYKRQKGNLEARLRAEDEVWRGVYTSGRSSSWIFNSIVNKHADIIDSMPAFACLPREKRDEAAADTLTKVIPVICERAGMSQVYSDNAWEKLKHGTAIWGVFWNRDMEDGLGDVDIRSIRLSDIFWEMGVSDIQDSGDLFIISYADAGALESLYPHFKYAENSASNSSLAASLGYSAIADGKCIVVDHYYKRYLDGGRSVLHLCKFCGDEVLFSSEADGSYPDGWYAHGLYPVVFDRLYPCDDGVCGFGLISIASEAQDYINRVDERMISYADWASRVRFWAKRSLGVNEKEFLDLDRPIVEVEGDIDEEKLRQIEISPIDESVMESKKMKIDELKEITGARDVSQGGITGGVTAASAISVLREAGAKSSRDGIEESYRAFVKIIALIIDIVAEFYSSARIFRITGGADESEYIRLSGRELSGLDGYRPHFDIEVTASKKSPSAAKEKNELARSLYEAGAFEPERVKGTLMMLELMDFDGVEKLKASLRREYLEVGGV